MEFLDLEINQKNYIRILVLSIVIVFLILGIYYITLLFPKKYTLKAIIEVLSLFITKLALP